MLIDSNKISEQLPLELFIGDFEFSLLSVEVVLDQFSGAS